MKTPKKELDYIHDYSKELRDRIALCIELWIKDTNNHETKNDEFKKRAANKVIECAYSSLVWKTLKKSERYNTKYYQLLSKDLIAKYPDLQIVNSLNTFVAVPVFNVGDIDVMFNPKRKIKALFRTKN
jgi:hypothetical protein